MISIERWTIVPALFFVLWASDLSAAPPAPSAPPKDRADAALLYVRDLVFDPVASPPKLAPTLRAAKETGFALVQYQPHQGVALAIDVFEAAPAVARAIGGFGKVWLVGPNQEHVMAEISAKDLLRLAALPNVRSVEVAAIGTLVRAQSAPPNFDNLDGTNQEAVQCQSTR